MALTKRSESQVIFLQAKHFCLWQELKEIGPACDAIEVTNPKTKETTTKYGYKYETVTGFVVDLTWYDTGDKYSTRYFGFKMKIRDVDQEYSLDMPYKSQILRRFLRTVDNIDWNKPLSISVFKGRAEDGKDPQIGIWFRQNGETVRPYFTKENPNGMPSATYDKDTQEWDFKAQHSWLVAHLKEDIIPKVLDAAAHVPEVLPRETSLGIAEYAPAAEPAPAGGMPDDDDMPF